LLAPFAGIILDRIDKKRSMQITSTIGALWALTLAYLMYTNRLTIAWLGSLSFIMGCVNAFDSVARSAILKEVVQPGGNLKQVSYLFSVLYPVSQVIGPLLAGICLLSIGYAGSFAVNAITFIALIIVLGKMSLKSTDILRAKAGSIWEIVRESGQYILTHKKVRNGILLGSISCMFGFSYFPLLAVISETVFHGDTRTYSSFAGAAGAGQLVGALLALVLGERYTRTFIVGGIILTGCALTVLAQVSEVWQGMFFLFLVGVGFSCSVLSIRADLMHHAEHQRIGSVLGVNMMMFFGTLMLGASLGGYFAKHYGCSVVLLGCGICLLLIGVAVWHLHRQVSRKIM
jgi:MFS family permease